MEKPDSRLTAAPRGEVGARQACAGMIQKI